MTIDDRMSREAVALLLELAKVAGETTIRVYAPGVIELAQFYLDHLAGTPEQSEQAHEQ